MSNGSNVTAKQDKEKKAEDAMTSDEREEQLRIAAYYRWKAKGEKHGSDEDDWFEAEDSMADDIVE